MKPMILTSTRVYRDAERIAIEPFPYVWRGPADAPVFAFENCRDFRIENIDVTCETACSAVFLCERTKTVAGTIPSTMHHFRNVRIFGNGQAVRGFWYRATVDENNEHGDFHANTIYGVANPFVFEGQQSKHHRLTHNVVESYDVGVSADSAFHWSGGTLAVGRIAFELARVGDPVTIADVGVEATARLLETAGPTTAAQPVIVNNVRFEADQLHADDEMIRLRHAGPLVIIGGRYGGGTQRIPRVGLWGTGAQTVRIAGAHFGSYGAADVPVVKAAPGVAYTVSADGCVYQAAAGAAVNTVALGTVFVERIQ